MHVSIIDLLDRGERSPWKRSILPYAKKDFLPLVILYSIDGKIMIPLIAQTFSSTSRRKDLSLNFTGRLFCWENEMISHLSGFGLKEVAFGKARYLVDLNLKGGRRSG